MKRKGLVTIIALFTMCLFVACGDDSGSAVQTATETNTEDNEEISAEPISAENVEETESMVAEPETEKDSEPEQVDEQRYIEVISDDVRVRSSASTETSDNILGKVKKGNKYVKTGDEDDWSKLDFNGQEGFIKSEFVKEISKEEYVSKSETAENDKSEDQSESKQDTTVSKQQQDDSQAQQAALLEKQQEALLAQQQEAAAALDQQQQATAANSSGGGGSAENTQLRSDRTVYITPTGRKYHYDQQCAGKNAIPKNLDDVSGSYEPCGTCVLQ